MRSIKPTKTMMSETPQKFERESYKPWIIAGTEIAKVYSTRLYLGYKWAKARKYPAIPHQQACKKGRLVNLAIFKKKDTSYVCSAFTVI